MNWLRRESDIAPAMVQHILYLSLDDFASGNIRDISREQKRSWSITIANQILIT
jgi:hypothetical protein